MVLTASPRVSPGFSPLPGAAWLDDVTRSQNPGAARSREELGRRSQPSAPTGFPIWAEPGSAGRGPAGRPQPPALALPQEAQPGVQGGVGKGGERRKVGSHRGSCRIRLGWKCRADAAPGQGSDLRPRSLPSCHSAGAVTGARG